MKIRNPRLLKAAGWVGTRLVRGLVGSLRTEVLELGHLGDPRRPTADRAIYCVWHEYLLFGATRFGTPNMAVLISRHADGKLLGALIESFGMGMVCGSSTRGGIEAVRVLTRDTSARQHLAVTPDGPRGPRRVMQPGAVYIASRTGMKIVPVGVGYRRPWRAGSWDRFAVPKPFSRACCIGGEAIAVPPGLKADGLEEYRLRVEVEMNRLTMLAEEWAGTGLKPKSLKSASLKSQVENRHTA
jgi:hypothetical protein